MTPKHDLYELIQSLTDGEISAFRKKILKRKGKHVYMKVFDEMLQQPHYDEADLKEKFSGEKTLNNFSIAKKNLYEKLMEELCAMPHHQDIESQFDKFRQQISILVKISAGGRMRTTAATTTLSLMHSAAELRSPSSIIAKCRWS